MLTVLAQGTKNRRVRSTNMNQTSSRSHAVFTIYLEVELTANVKRTSAINLVDLAGSECLSGNTGEALVEGKSINKSLSAFKNVFLAMKTGEKRIPFRESLITNMLTGMSTARILFFVAVQIGFLLYTWQIH